MNIAIIGAGNVGRALGNGWTAAGHRVVFGLRDPSNEKGERLAEAGHRPAPIPEAVAVSNVVVLATPWAAVRPLLESLGDLGGRILLDATNPIVPGFKLEVGHTASGGELVQQWAPSARVVKIFNSIGAENMANPEFPEGRATMFYCGDDAGAREVAGRLAEDLGFDAVSAGPLSSARLLEPLGFLWIHLAMVQKRGRGIAFRLMRRP